VCWGRDCGRATEAEYSHLRKDVLNSISVCAEDPGRGSSTVVSLLVKISCNFVTKIKLSVHSPHNCYFL
jgi:hypothetical protein